MWALQHVAKIRCVIIFSVHPHPPSIHPPRAHTVILCQSEALSFRSLWYEITMQISLHPRWQQAPLHPGNDGTLPGSHPGASDRSSKYHDPDIPWHNGLGAEEKWQLQTSHYNIIVLLNTHCVLWRLLWYKWTAFCRTAYPHLLAECVCVGGSRADG